MAQHTSPRCRADELRFPVRIKIRVPPDGLGVMLDQALSWLEEEVGRGNFAQWPVESIGGSATAFHFRAIEDAARFFAAFPMFELADSSEAAELTSRASPGRRADLR